MRVPRVLILLLLSGSCKRLAESLNAAIETALNEC